MRESSALLFNRFLSLISIILLGGASVASGGQSFCLPGTRQTSLQLIYDYWNHDAAPNVSLGKSTGYLDGRIGHWLNHQANGKTCICCHTVLPYTMIRSGLNSGADHLAQIRANIIQRLDHFDDVKPWYPSHKVASRSTEAVTNAAALSFMDSSTAPAALRPETQRALDLMLAQQEPKGGYPWLDRFRLAPFEDEGSAYWGNSLALLAVEGAPGQYAKRLANPDQLLKLKNALKADFPKQDLHNQLMALWASAKTEGVLTTADRYKLVAQLVAKQRPDGGWDLPTLLSPRVIQSPAHRGSDGYATGLSVLALLQSGERSVAVQKAVAWLRENQKTDGTWAGTSVNKDHSQNHLFATDQATSYALLALDAARKAGI